jgi:hypothetical protein
MNSTISTTINSYDSRISEYESYIDNLMHQQKLLQNIEKHSNFKLDFGDFLETNNIVASEIERLRLKLREQRVFPGENMI